MSSSNSPGSGFARHPRHLPTPIITGISSEAEAVAKGANLGRMEPRPSPSLPSFRQFVDGSERESNFEAASIRSGPSPRSTLTAAAWHGSPIAPSPGIDVDTMMKRTTETLNEQLRANGYDPHDQASNPYQERADQIGLSHRIPGVGHLGDLLTPPGWKPGDEPIPPDRAHQLQHEAYDAAKKKLDDSILNFKHLKGTAFQEASDLNNEEWQNQVNLNKVIFEERVRVYQAHENGKANGGQLLTQQLPVLNIPQPNGTYTQHFPHMDVAPARSMQIQRPIPQPLHLLHPSGSYGRPEPSPKDLSPSLLDPSLVHGTVQSVVNNYNRKQQELLRMLEDNKVRMTQCLGRYGPHIRPGYQAQQAPPHPQQLVRRPSAHAGMETSRLPQVYYEDRGLTANRYAPLPGQNVFGIHDEPVELALTPVKNRDYGATPPPDEEQAQPGSIGSPSRQAKRKTPAKKVSPKKPSTSTPKLTKSGLQKKEPWYAADLAAATARNPPPEITLESINALLASDTKDIKKTPAKKRRRADEPVKPPEHKMSDDKIKALWKSPNTRGQMRWTGPGANPYLSDDDGNNNGNAAGTVAPATRHVSASRLRARNTTAQAAGPGTSASSPLFVSVFPPPYSLPTSNHLGQLWTNHHTTSLLKQQIDEPSSNATSSSAHLRSPSTSASEYVPDHEAHGGRRRGGASIARMVPSARKARVPAKRAHQDEESVRRL